MNITLYFTDGAIVEYDESTIDSLEVGDTFFTFVHDSYKKVSIYNKNQIASIEVTINDKEYLDEVKGLIHAN